MPISLKNNFGLTDKTYSYRLLNVASDWASNLPFSPIKSQIEIIVGGSIAKSTADENSDIDLCILYNGHLSSLIDYFGNSKNKILWQGDVPSGYNATLDSGEGHLLDLHFVELQQCRQKIQDFLTGQDFGNAVQDLLWNLKHGISVSPASKNIAGLRDSIFYPSKVQSLVLRKHLDALGLHRLDVYQNRMDGLQLAESTTTIRKVVLCINYAILHELFWGFKNTQFIYPKLTKSSQEILVQLDKATLNATKVDSKYISEKMGDIYSEVNNLLEFLKQ